MRADLLSGASAAVTVLVDRGQFADAMSLFGKLPRDEAAHPQVQLAAASAAMRLGDLPVANRLAHGARRRLRRATDAPHRLAAGNLLGAIAFTEGRLADAEVEFRTTRDVASQVGDTLVQARTSQNLAILADLSGATERALAAYEEALAGYTSLAHHRGIAEIQHNRSITLRLAGLPHEALRAADAAMEAAEEVGDLGLKAQVALGLTECLMATNHIVPAGAALRAAKAHAEAAGAALTILEASRISARAHLMVGEPEEALRLAEAAVKGAVQRGAEQLRCESLAVRALALRALGRLADANLSMADVRRGLKRLGAPNLLAHLEAEWERGETGAHRP